MQFLKIASILAAAATTVLATAATENIVTLQSVDDQNRTVYFTPNSGLDPILPVSVPAGESVNVTIPQGWIGNYYSVTDGKDNKAGMLAEVAFNGWNGLTYFDVSAIVDPTDLEGVAEMWPASSKTPTSGCQLFPCPNAYYLSDDVQTKVTSETHLITTLGKSGVTVKRGEDARTGQHEDESKNVKRSFVEGKRRWF